MIFKGYVGYIEGQDISTIPTGYLAAPSKDIIIKKGVAFTRPGITNDGTAPTGQTKIIGERAWKDALGGEKDVRVTQDGRFQVKWKGMWITIYSGITPTATRVRFDTWIDDNGVIIKKRLFGVDGTDAIYEWNGAIGTVATIDQGAHTVTLAESGTAAKLGFDDGSSTPQPIEIVRIIDGEAQTPDVYETASDMSTQTIGITSAFTNLPSAGDLVIGQVIKHTDVLAGVIKDDIYTYANHLGVASLTSITLYFSDEETKLDFTIPNSMSLTALSAFTINLDQNYTAMIGRYDAALKQNVLWISSVDDWLKVSALAAVDPSTNEWVETEQVAEAQQTGALPFCVSQQVGDIIFFAQDRTLQKITTVDVLAKDTLQLLSDEVEGLLARVDVTEARLYYLKRYIFITLPAEPMVVALDIVENHFQPPWSLPVQSMSVITINGKGVLCGHSNSRDETFTMLTGTSDLGADIESIFAFPYYQGFQFHRTKVFPQDLQRKKMNTTGISGRMTKTTKITVQQFFETDGSEAQDTWVIDGSTATLYSLPAMGNWASDIWGDESYGGGDDDANPLQRVYAFSKYDAVSWFESRMIMTVTGKDQQFTLVAWEMNDWLSENTVPDDLFIERLTP